MMTRNEGTTPMTDDTQQASALDQYEAKWVEVERLEALQRRRMETEATDAYNFNDRMAERHEDRKMTAQDLDNLYEDMRNLALQITRDHETRIAALEQAATLEEDAAEASEEPTPIRSLNDLPVAKPGILSMSGVSGSLTFGNVDGECLAELFTEPVNPWTDQAVWDDAMDAYENTSAKDGADFRAFAKVLVEAGATLENHPDD